MCDNDLLLKISLAFFAAYAIYKTWCTFRSYTASTDTAKNDALNNIFGLKSLLLFAVGTIFLFAANYFCGSWSIESESLI